IKGFYPELSAAVNSAVKLNGSFQNPSARITANIKKAKYSGIPFSFDADFISRNGKISVKKFDLVSDKTRISASGVYSKIGKLNIVFEKIPEKLINKFVGFVTPVKGDFSGSGTLIQRNGRKHLKMFLTGENTSVKNVKISGFKSNFEIYKNKISLSSASAKIADSEIKAPSGSFNLKTGSYGLELKLVNTHVGPVDVFGNVILSGSMKKKKGGSEYRGTITLNNFWINRYKLLQSEFNYHIHNKIFEFASANSKPNIFKSSGTVVFGEGVFIKNFIVEHEKSLFVMNSGIASDNIEIDIKGKDLSLDFITDAFGIPVSMSGTANLRVDFEGNPSNPSATIKTQSSGGSISEIPYDNFEVEIVSKDNRAEIKKAVIYKKNEINVLASGFFPFWIDSTLKNKMRKLPVNISYSIEDPKMTIFKYISQGYVEPLSGKLSLKGSVKGTFDKISNNGQFTITGGSLDVKRYLDKIKDFNADISIVDNLITLNKLSAKSGTGKITGTGTVFLEGFTPQKFDLRFFTENKGIPVKIPELAIPSFIGSKVLLQDYSSGEPRFDITLTGSAEKPKIAGTVILENTRFTFPSANKSSGGDSALPEDTEFDLELKSAKNTRFENSFADAWINGSVFLKGTKNNIRASGIIDSQRGSIQYLGIEFNIINVKVEIMEDHSIYITAEGESEVYSSNKSVSEAIRLVIDRSEINSLNVRFYSRDDPTMDSQTALAKLTKTEQTTERRNRELLLGIITEFDLRQQALRLFDTNFATPFTRTVLRRTGLVDNFKVSYVAPDRDPALVDDTSFVNLLLGTKYSLEKNLTNQFLLGYSLTFDRYDQLERRLDLKHEIEMKYRLANNLFLSGSYELESEASMHQPDRKLMLQHQIRFGQPAKKTN
ncbi:MAG: translocation/assembly module TamB, partial [Endomicrobia bacterium]|nr:translocation/assembly module TamB [Endomicrobiia bacterium]